MQRSTKTRITLLLLIPVGMLLSSPTAVAADDPEPGPLRYDFNDDLVRGDLMRPDGEVLTVHERSGRPSLVRARLHFIDKLAQSLETLDAGTPSP